MPSSLSHVYLSVGSLEATRQLFVDLLGLEVLIDGGGYVRIGGGGGFHAGIEQEPSGEPIPTELVIRVDDVDAMTRAAARGRLRRHRSGGPGVGLAPRLVPGRRRPLDRVYTPIDPGG